VFECYGDGCEPGFNQGECDACGGEIDLVYSSNHGCAMGDRNCGGTCTHTVTGVEGGASPTAVTAGCCIGGELAASPVTEAACMIACDDFYYSPSANGAYSDGCGTCCNGGSGSSVEDIPCCDITDGEWDNPIDDTWSGGGCDECGCINLSTACNGQECGGGVGAGSIGSETPGECCSCSCEIVNACGGCGAIGIPQLCVGWGYCNNGQYYCPDGSPATAEYGTNDEECKINDECCDCGGLGPKECRLLEGGVDDGSTGIVYEAYCGEVLACQNAVSGEDCGNGGAAALCPKIDGCGNCVTIGNWGNSDPEGGISCADLSDFTYDGGGANNRVYDPCQTQSYQ
jgi:hypothetical protein